MYITCKILSVDEEEIERAEDLGMEPEVEWINFGFNISTLRMFYDYMQEGERLGTIIMLDDYSDFTTDLDFEYLEKKLEEYHQSPSWIISSN